MKVKCPYCKRPLNIPYDKIKRRVMHEIPSNHGPWIAIIVAAVGIAGALGLVGGIISTRFKDKKAQTQIAQLQGRIDKLTKDRQAMTIEREGEAKRLPKRSQPAIVRRQPIVRRQHLITDLQAEREELRERNLRQTKELRHTRKPPLARSLKPTTTQEPTTGWPFEARIPDGFAFEGTQIWQDRKLWILKGRRFGKAYETIVVVQTDSSKILSDTYRAAYWASEICLGCSLGTCTLETASKSFVMTYKEFDNQVINCPSHQSHAYDPGLSLSLESFGKSDTYVPSGLGACSGRLDGTNLVVGWAGSYGKLLDTRKMVAAFCYNIRRKVTEGSRARSRSRR